jgi:hypothetical protein
MLKPDGRFMSRVPLTNHYSFLNLPKKPKTHPSFSDSLASTTRIEPILSDEDPDRTPRARTSNLPPLLFHPFTMSLQSPLHDSRSRTLMSYLHLFTKPVC